MRINQQELATILAGLRLWQKMGLEHAGAYFQDIATDGGTLRALTTEEIDLLCERINCGG